MLCPKCNRDFFSIDNNPRGTTVENYIKCNKCREIMLEKDVIKFNNDYYHEMTYCDKHSKPKTNNMWGYYECKQCNEENQLAREEEIRLKNWNKYKGLHHDLYVVQVNENPSDEIWDSFKRLDDYFSNLKEKYHKKE